MKRFPVDQRSDLALAMMNEIAGVVKSHLGFSPEAMVLILTDHKQNQTLFSGNDQKDFSQLLLGGADNHRKSHRLQ